MPGPDHRTDKGATMKQHTRNWLVIAFVPMLWVSSAEGQRGDPARPKMAARCPVENPPELVRCAREKARNYNPLRTIDGQPNIQGFWNAEAGGAGTGETFAGYGLEGKIEKSWFVIQGAAAGRAQPRLYRSVVVDPADGRIPYTRFAAAKTQEYFNYVDRDTIHYEATMEDATVYTRPWTMVFALTRRQPVAGYELLEDSCHEGERSVKNMLEGNAR